jgi:preprotein translocase subunit SecB
MKPLAAPDRVIANIQIEDVRLRAGSFRRRVASPAQVGKVDVEISHEAHAETLPGRSAFLVVFTGKVALRPVEAASKEPALEAEVEIELRYGYPEGLDLRPDELQPFANLNGVFNAWPYFREFIQNATTRMGLPPFVLPVFRVRKAEPAGKAARKATSSRRAPRR